MKTYVVVGRVIFNVEDNAEIEILCVECAKKKYGRHSLAAGPIFVETESNEPIFAEDEFSSPVKCGRCGKLLNTVIVSIAG